MLSYKYKHLILTLIILVCALALRGMHIDADTPSGLSWSAGLYVDEGYKTLSPRNLILFGDTHWHDADTYPGWMRGSPVTQWSIYAAFKTFGANISSARIVPIIYFLLLILLYIFFMRRRYPAKLFYLGLILLVTDITLFTFSRVALFEIPISFFLYAMILPLATLGENKKISIAPFAWLLIGSFTIAYTLKMSALIYSFPVLSAALIHFVTNSNNITKKQITFFAIVLLIATSVTLTITHDIWSERIGVTPLLYIYHVIENPLLQTSPFLLIASTLCAAHVITYQSSQYVNNLYRLSLICMVVMAPFLLSIFSYQPLRYFVPFAPASLLLIIEWFRTTSVDKTYKATNYALSSLGSLLLGLSIMYTFIALDIHEQIQMRLLLIISSVIVLVLLGIRHYLFSSRISISVVATIVLMSVIHNIYFIQSFVIDPSYQAKKMRTQLTKVVKNDEIISGGWAPFLALGTPLKVIYANDMFNLPNSLKAIKPDYFILSKTLISLETFDTLKNDESIIIGTPVNLGAYNETNVLIYPLSYKDTRDLPQ